MLLIYIALLSLTKFTKRPFVCTTCNKSYLRETHLQAHARSHLPNSDRPFVCGKSDCNKRFWTAQHLKAHLEVIHHGEKPFKVGPLHFLPRYSYPCGLTQCSHERCTAAFPKHHQLRAHIASEHAPSGTKPYQCDHGDCTKSFSTNQKLHAHLKVHEGTGVWFYAMFYPYLIALLKKSDIRA